nr:hypothetical protein KPHV_12680 [Kitasatospora purpeofusca]
MASYCMPGGIFATDLASIGATGGMTGRSMLPILAPTRSGRAAARGPHPGGTRGGRSAEAGTSAEARTGAQVRTGAAGGARLA